MGARIIARSPIRIPCAFPPLATCYRGEIGIIETDEGWYKVSFAESFSGTPVVNVSGVGIWRLTLWRWTINLPVPVIVYEVSSRYFKYWLPKGQAYIMYIAFETSSAERIRGSNMEILADDIHFSIDEATEEVV